MTFVATVTILLSIAIIITHVYAFRLNPCKTIGDYAMLVITVVNGFGLIWIITVVLV